MEQRPSIGRDVHYVSYGTPGGEFESTCRTAKITEVDASDAENPDVERVGLCVFNPTGIFFHPLVQGGSTHDEEGHAGGSWHWPERV